MNLIKVDSSNIDKIGYDINSSILRIEFLDGSIYEYNDVPKDVFESFMKAESKGSFGHKNIYRKYKQRKLN